ncbi:PaaI family thioesterase [Actinomadura craniellae]|uniref:PaaI family thioesterase n=1 Tax=Actinomadura craniellae TaxID=2231787 RepID=A0A365HFV8_9ACTN|nr:hotdog domain-containing protein [Actinomadura craniellae]RAY16983.1 PaaI family thioesterase [Actinomadura craniellae]
MGDIEAHQREAGTGADGHAEPRTHIVSELGMAVRLVGDELHGSAPVVPEMYVPGTGFVRTSILATWADVLAGMLIGGLLAPRVPVTLELAVDLYGEPPACASLHGVGRIIKAGRSVAVASVDFTTDGGEPVAMGTASFMAAPDVTLTLPPLATTLAGRHAGGPLTAPFAERAGCERREPGVAVLARSDDALNASHTIQGGLIALAAEEAVLSRAPGTTLASLAMRYLRPARVGPLVATAAVHGDLARVDVRDAGSDGRLTVSATTRTFPPRG